MSASLTDKLHKVGASTVTTLESPGKEIGASSITVGSTENYPTDTGIIVAIRVVDTNGELVAGTYTEWRAIVASETTLTLATTPAYGTDQVYSAGSTTQVFIPASAQSQNDLVDAFLAEHNQQGEHTTAGVAGEIKMYGGAAAPIGWLLCQGQSLLRDDYTDLFAVIGTAFGSADGTHFNIPDLRDNFPVGKSGTKDLGAVGGEATHTLTSSEIPSHTHYLGGKMDGYAGSSKQKICNYADPAKSNDYLSSETGGGDAHNNLPPYVAINFIIKT